MDKIFRFDFTSNVLRQDAASRSAIEKEELEYLISQIPAIVDRMGELPAYITAEVGVYTNLMEEARKCYEFCLYHAAIAMIGIAAERFAFELSLNIRFFINDNAVKERELYDREIKQFKRLELLQKGDLITKSAYDTLEKLRVIRNKYVHPSEGEATKEDALKSIQLFNDVIHSRFSEKFVFQDGKIVARSQI